MPKDLGDTLFDGAIEVKETSDGNGSAGDAVEIDGSDQVSPTDASTDDIYGILASDMSDVSAGDEVSVVIFGPVVANLGGSVAKNDLVIPSSTAGQLAQNGDSTGSQVDVDGTTDQGVFAPGNPRALCDSGATFHGHSFGTNEGAIFMR